MKSDAKIEYRIKFALWNRIFPPPPHLQLDVIKRETVKSEDGLFSRVIECKRYIISEAELLRLVEGKEGEIISELKR